MAITSTTVIRTSGAAAVVAGAVFIGVQLDHPPLDAAAVTSTEWAVRSSLKVVMAALALAGITGMYVHQVATMRVLGAVGYLLFAANYLVILSTSFVAAYVLPSIADTSPAYVEDVLAVASGGRATGDIGLLGTVLLLESVLCLAGGLLFGVALHRSNVLPRWAAALLAVGGAVSAGLSLLPDPWFRLLALPNGIAMIALGSSLWRVAGSDVGAGTGLRRPTATPSTGARTPRTPAGGVG